MEEQCRWSQKRVDGSGGWRSRWLEALGCPAAGTVKPLVFTCIRVLTGIRLGGL